MGAQWGGAVVWGLAAVAAVACTNTTLFVCYGDSDCDNGGVAGRCQLTGYCSFPDADCDSGQRYGELAEDALANTCVEPDVESMGPSSATATAADPTVTPMPSTTTSASATTVLTLDGTTIDPSTSTMDGDDDPSEDDSRGESTGEVSGCVLADFEDGLIDPYWCPVEDDGMLLYEQDGRLWAEFVPEDWGMGGGSSFIEACASFLLDGTTVEVRVGVVPAVMPNGTAFFEVGNAEGRLAMSASVSRLYVLEWNGSNYQQVFNEAHAGEPPYDWRIRGTPEGLVAERSMDGGMWFEVHTMQMDTNAPGNLMIGGYGIQPPMNSSTAGFDFVEICEESEF